MTILSLLSEQYPVINALNRERQIDLLNHTKLIKVPAGTQLFDELQPCEGFPFVLEGAVRVVKRMPDMHRELPLYRIMPGETCIITSSCLLGRMPYNAYGITESETQLILIPADIFENLLNEPIFRRFIFNLFSERMLELMQLVEEVAFRKLDQRLAAQLLGKGPLLHVTHQQLADELGSVREIVSRLLKNFATQGLVRLSREQIDIIDPAGLRRLAGSTH